MALIAGQLGAAITSSQLTFPIINLTGVLAPPVGGVPLSYGYPMQIDSEMVFIVSQPVAGTVVVRGRGSDGTVAVGHDILANVYTSPSPADFPAPFAGTQTTIDPTEDLLLSVGQDGVIALPPSIIKNAIININKGSAAALTLTAPSLASNGLQVTITSQTAFAHVVTATGLFADGTSGSPHTTATFTGQKGASIFLVAENGLWNVASAPQNVTIS